MLGLLAGYQIYMEILLEFNSRMDILFNRKYLKIRSLSFEL
jgi:hypothetical protein